MAFPPTAPGLPGWPGSPPSGTGMAEAAPMVPWHRQRWVGVALAALGVGVVGIGGLMIFGFLGTSLGPAVFALAMGAAALPVPILLTCFWWLDRYEPEPFRYLVFVFAWGACVATAAALIINTTGGQVIAGAGGSDSTTAVLIAPPTEEFFKALPLFLLLLLTLTGRVHLNGVVDGIVYAGVCAVGFAFTENILYFGAAYIGDDQGNGGLGALLTLFVLRAVFSPFAHPLFTCMTGIGIGIAVRSRQQWVKIAAPIGGLALAILLHGTWNLLASSGDPTLIIAGYGLVMLPVLVVLIVVAIVLRSREAKVVGRVLPVYVQAGWFTDHELASLATMAGRRAARRWARRIAGGLGAKAMADYQFAATKLAMARDTLARGLGGDNFALEERRLLATVDARRQLILQRARPGVAGPWGGRQSHGRPHPGHGSHHGQGAPGHGHGALGYGPGSPGYGHPGHAGGPSTDYYYS